VIAAGLPSVLLIATASLLAQGGWDLKLKSLILIGDASYILYLIHPYVEYFCDRVLAHRLSWLNVQHAPGAAITTLASILAAVIIHVTLERPVSQFLHRKLATKPNVLQPAVASLV
jgi:exopolysaccharide production protein ExoZ